MKNNLIRIMVMAIMGIGLGFGGPVHAAYVDFDRDTTGWGGTIIDDEYSSMFAVSAFNPNRDWNHAVIWDLETYRTGRDDADLITPRPDGNLGNMPDADPRYAQRDLLIISELEPGSMGFYPDDEAGRGSYIDFLFVDPIIDFEMIFVDLDDKRLSQYGFDFFGESGNLLGGVTFQDLYDNNAFDDEDLGNNSVNFMDPTLADLFVFPTAGDLVGKVRFNFGGSGGIGSIGFDASTQVPEPMTIVMLGIGLVGIAVLRRHRKSRS